MSFPTFFWRSLPQKASVSAISNRVLGVIYPQIGDFDDRSIIFFIAVISLSTGLDV